MTWVLLAGGGVLLLLVVLLAVLVAQVARLRRRVVELETHEPSSDAPGRISASADLPHASLDEPGPGYVITHLGDEPAEAAPTVEARLFTDIVLRETVVQAAALFHGVRRALAPETRNRIRFEMRREVRRSRKQRRANLREARREWEARQRAGLTMEDTAA